LKGKTYNRRDFAKLRRILFLRASALTALATVFIWMLRALVQGKMANWLVFWIQRIFSLDRAAAILFYREHIRSPNLDYLIGVAILIFTLLLFWIQLNAFQHYFSQIVRGIDQILEGEAPITLPAELQFVEQKLNQTKQTLLLREQEVRQKEQQKNDLIVYLAHDIRTPLTSVVGYLSLLDENAALSDTQKQRYIHIAKEKANRLERLVSEFFELSRYHFQAVPLNKTHINLCYMAVQLSDELYPQLAAARKSIKIEIAEHIDLYGDADKLARAFNNLLKNAITYGAERDTIRISASETPNETIIAFENGGTIPQEELNAIFEKFYRLNPARSSETGGSGLGLAIAKDIITLHGGSIHAASAHGRIIFTVFLPRASVCPEPETA